MQRKTNGTVDRYYLWDNGQVLAILDGTATHRIAEFVYFGGADQPLARITGATTTDTVHYYAQDASGNVIAQFQGTTIEQSLAYDPWGATTISSHPDSTQLRWKGLLYEDGITSLYYVRARWYDPITRRFVSPDPFGMAAGVNQYAYAGGDPIAGSDPSGLCKAGEIQQESSMDGAGVVFHACGNTDGDVLYYEDDYTGFRYTPYIPLLATVPITAQASLPLAPGATGAYYYGATPSFAPAGSLGGGGGASGQPANNCPAFLNNPVVRATANAAWNRTTSDAEQAAWLIRPTVYAPLTPQRAFNFAADPYASFDPGLTPVNAVSFIHTHPHAGYDLYTGRLWRQAPSGRDITSTMRQGTLDVVVSRDSIFQVNPSDGAVTGCAR